MYRAIGILFVALASCSATNGETMRAPVSEPGIATRAHLQPVKPQARLVADYLIIDKSERLLVAYVKGRPIRTYRGLKFGDSPMGHKRFEGDERTPEGRYSIDTRNPRSRFHLSLRISYPNARDRAFAAQYGRSPGGDIFIHGQPTDYRGPPLQGDWTDGCIALPNVRMEELWRIVPDGTPIEIRP